MKSRRTVRWVWAVILGLALFPLALSSLAQAEEPPGDIVEIAPPPVGVRSQQGEGYRRLDAVLPGILLSTHSLPSHLLSAQQRRAEGGSTQLLLLVAPEGGDEETPLTLYRLDTTGDGELVELSREIPGDVTHLLSLGSDSSQGSVFASRPGELLAVEIREDAATLRSVLKSPLAGPGSRARQALAGPPAPGDLLSLVEVGKLTLFELGPGGRFRPTTERLLPVAAKREARSLLLTSPPVTELPRTEGARPMYAAGPEPQGDRRLRTVLMQVAGAEEAEGDRREAWSRLPGPEKVARSWYAWLDGQPVLLVATLRSDKLGIFEKQKLRLFRLTADRSRSGRKPSLEIHTDSRRWFEIEPQILDVTGDSRDDLVLLQLEGLGGGDLVVEVFVGLGGGGFHRISRRTKLDLPAHRWHFGADLSGDGRPDLVALAKGNLYIFAGLPDHPRKVLEKKPWRILDLQLEEGSQEISVEVDAGPGGTSTETHLDDSSRMTLEDLDGDGRSEVLLSRGSHHGRGVVRIVWLDP